MAVVLATSPTAVSPPSGEVHAAEVKVDRKQPTEYEMKAAYLLHFLKFTTWPEGSFKDEQKRLAPIELFVIGDDPFGKILDATFKGQAPQGRKVGIRRLAAVPDNDEALPGHVVFAALERELDRRELIGKASGRAVLVVGEVEGFAEQGGCVNFFLEGKHVRFEVNVDALKGGALQVSPDLLKLAKIVRNERSEPRTNEDED